MYKLIKEQVKLGENSRVLQITEDLLLDDVVRTEDVQNVQDLIEGTGVFSAEEIKISSELVEEALANPEAYKFLFLRKGKELLAYSCYGEICLTNKRFDLYWIAVSKEYQKHKYASLILEHTEKAIKQLGGVKLYAETSSTPSYYPARSFYRKSGFKTVSEIEDFYKDGDNKITFCKELI